MYTVHNRFVFQVAPVKITRSVGLQVMTQEQKRLQQQRQLAGAGVGAGARIATKPAQAVVIRNTDASPVTPSSQVRKTVPAVATRGVLTHPASEAAVKTWLEANSGQTSKLTARGLT